MNTENSQTTQYFCLHTVFISRAASDQREQFVCPVTVLEDRVQKLVLLQGELFSGLLPTSGGCPQLLVFLGSSSVAPSLPPVSLVTCLLPEKAASRWISVLLLCTCSLLSLMMISKSLLPNKAMCTGSGWTRGDTLQPNIFVFFPI